MIRAIAGVAALALAGCANLAEQAPAGAGEAAVVAVQPETEQRLAAAEAEYRRALEAVNAAVSRRYVGETMEPRYAAYVDQVLLRMRAVAQVGPPAPPGRGGTAQLVIAIRADGSLESVEVGRSSGDAALDAWLARLVTRAAPFDAFPPEVRRDTSVLVLTRTIDAGAGGAPPAVKPRPPARKPGAKPRPGR